MKASSLVAVLAVVVLAGSPASAATNVAVFNFQMTSETAEWGWLQKGLADRIATDFVQDADLDVVARDRMQMLAAEMRWVPEMATSDPDRMGKVRKALKIEYLVTGVYRVTTDGGIHLTGQIVEVDSRKEVARKEVEGKAAEVLDLQRRLSAELLAWFSKKPAAAILERLPVWTRSLPAAKALYEGMDLYDQGRYAEGWLKFRQASREDPGYVEAVYWTGKMYYFLHRYGHARRMLEKFVYLDTAHPRLGDAMVEYVHTYEASGASGEDLLRRYEALARRYPNARIKEGGSWGRDGFMEAEDWFEFKSFELLGQLGRHKEVAQRSRPCLWQDYYGTPARAPVSYRRPCVCRRNVLLHQALTGEAFGRDTLVNREWGWCERMLLAFDEDATARVYEFPEPTRIAGEERRNRDKRLEFAPTSVEIPLVLAAPDGHVFESARFCPLAEGSGATVEVGITPAGRDPSCLFRICPPVSAALAPAREHGVFWKDLPRHCILRACCRFVAKGPTGGPVVVRGVRVEPAFRRVARPGAIDVRCADTHRFMVHVDGIFARWFPGLIGPLPPGEHRIGFLPADQGPWPETGLMTSITQLFAHGLRISPSLRACVYLPTPDKQVALRTNWETTVRVKEGEVTRLVGRLPYKEGSGWEKWKTAGVAPDYLGYDVRLHERSNCPPAVEADEQAIRVIWSQRGDLWRSVCTDEETFSPPRKLDLPLSSGWCEYAPRLIRDEAGRFLLAFLSDRDARHLRLPYISWSRDFVHWSAPVQITDETTPGHHALVQDGRGRLWWAKADLKGGIAIYSSRHGYQWKRVMQLQPAHQGAEVTSVDLLPSGGGGIEAYAAERAHKYKTTWPNLIYEYHVVRHVPSADGRGARSETVFSLPPSAVEEFVCGVTAARDTNGPALLVQLQSPLVLLRKGLYSRSLMTLLTITESETWRRWATLPSVASGPHTFVYAPGRGYLIGWVGEAPKTSPRSSYGPFVTWGPTLVPLRQACVDSTDGARKDRRALVKSREPQRYRMTGADGKVRQALRRDRTPRNRFLQQDPSKQPIGSAGSSPVGQLKWLPIPPQQSLYRPYVYLKGAEHFREPVPGDGTVNPHAVVAKVQKGETTVALAFDSKEPDAPHFDVVRIDTTGRGDFNSAPVVPRSSIQHIPAKEKYQYRFEEYGVSLSLAGRQIQAWFNLTYSTDGEEPYLGYCAGTAAEGRCQFGDRVYWVRFVDANRTLRVTDEPRVVSVYGDDRIEGDYVYIYTRGKDPVRASRGHYGQPIQADGRWWNVRVVDEGRRVTAEPYQGPLARLHLNHPFWRLVLRGRGSVISVNGGEEPVTVPAGRYTVHHYREYVSARPDSRSPNVEMHPRFTNFTPGVTVDLQEGTETAFPIGTPLRGTVRVKQKDGALSFDIRLRDCRGRGVYVQRFHTYEAHKDYDPVRIVITRQSDHRTWTFDTQWDDMGDGWKIPQGFKGTCTATAEFPSDTFRVECEPVTFTIE
ncbi:MAG: hypothetical protein R6X20_06630 [Phycisphaerae bacterium]